MADFKIINKEFYLCYVEGNKAYFTSDWENQWGDDWDDAPYEYNAGEPYTENYNAECLGVWNGCSHYPEIEQKVLYFEFKTEWIKLPCDGFINSPFSVKAINRGDIAWIRGSDFNIPAKTTYDDFIKIVESHNGIIYLPKENSLNSNDN